jgi:succinoglycan biosynthesis transport protein ExoP
LTLIPAEPLFDVAEPQATLETAESAVGNSSLLPDPRSLLIIFWRRIWTFLIVFAVIMGAAIAYATFAPKLYTSTASVLIEPRKADIVMPKEVAQPDQAAPADFIDTQILVLDSAQLSEKVVAALGLTEDAQFGGGASDQVEAPSPAQIRLRLATSAQRLQSAVNIRRAGQTSLIEIAVSTRSPAQSARIANEYVNQYLLSISNAKQAADQQENAQIDSRLGQLRVEAETADRNLQMYKIANGLMSSEGATMAEQEASTLNQQVAAARASLAERQGRLAAARRQLTKGGGGSDVASALSSGTIGALRQQEADSSRTLAQLHSRYGPRHPAIAQEEQRLADVQRQIQLEIDRILSSLEAEVNVAASGLSSLLSSQGQSRSRLAGNASAQVGYMELERKATAARTIYEAFLNKSRGTAARDGIQQPLASLSSPAVAATAPSSPNVRLAYLVGFMSALTAALLAVALAEFLDGGIRTKLDVERRLGARYLGAVPDVESTLDGLRSTEEPHDYIVSHPLSTFAEALRSLRASVTLRGNRRPKVIAVTSALPREGKTTTAVSLARTLAMSGASTVLVDCDIRRHSASDILLEGREGHLLDVLAGTALLENSLLPDSATDLQILGTHRSPEDGRDLLAPGLVGPLLAALRTQFEYVVIDTAPVLGIADARSVASQADAVILLARWRRTSLRAADTALDLLMGTQAKVVGVALTMVDIRKFGSTGQEDVYGYHKKFKGYYVN